MPESTAKSKGMMGDSFIWIFFFILINFNYLYFPNNADSNLKRYRHYIPLEKRAI